MEQNEAQARFLAAYDEYADAIHRFCFVKVSNTEVAHDITQDSFMRLWQYFRDGKEVENERALLYTFARNLVIDWYRKKKEVSLDVLQEAGADFAGEDHRRITQSAEIREVMAVIEQLDDPSREVLLLRYTEGLSPQEIADLTGETANAISVRINRAVKKVQQLIHADETKS